MTNPSDASITTNGTSTRNDTNSSTGPGADRASSPAGPSSGARPRTLSYLAAIFLFWGLIYIPGLASPPMMDDVDSEHAEIAREMLSRQDFVTMYVNGVRYLEKAPLPYWIIAGVYKIFGVNEFSVRLPLTLFALFTFLAVFWLAREIAGEKAGFFSALAIGTAIGPYIYTRFLIPDIMVCFWLTITMHLFLKSLDQARPSRLVCWSIGIATALNVLTKGLIGVVFPVAILGAYLLITRNLRQLLRMRLVSTTLVFLVVAAPWHVLATIRNPPQGEAKGFFWFFFINDQIYRYLNMRVPRDYDKVPFLVFWGLVLVWLLPWTFFVLKSLGQVPARISSWRGRLEIEPRAALLMAVWTLFVLVFFSFSTRQEYYVLPVLPALAVLCGMWLSHEEASPIGSTLRRSGLRMSVALMVIGVIAFVVATFILVVTPAAPADTDFGNLLQKAPGMYKLSMGHLFDLTGRAMGAFRWPLVVTGIGFLTGTFFTWFFRKRGSPLRSNLALATMMVVLFYAVHVALTTFSPVLGSKPLAVAIEKQYRPGDMIIVDGAYSAASSINFYTGVQLHMLNGRYNDLWFGSLFPDSPPVFEDDASFAKLWLGPGRIFFIARNAKSVDKLKPLAAPYYEVARSGEKAVFSNRPTS
jgi:4-amino-4-deoxy-L-arabinose transferase-like glycosyltransferase